MKKIIIIVVVVIAIVALGFGAYAIFFQKNSTNAGNNGYPGGSQSGSLPSPTPASPSPMPGIPDYVGRASDVIGNLPTGDQLALGTSKGTVQVNNFYASNPPVVDGGSVIVKQAAQYMISYDPTAGSFWLVISGTPFETWRSAAEQDFLVTLGVSKSDACKLSVTSGVIYSPGDPNDGKSFPLSFCQGGAF